MQSFHWQRAVLKIGSALISPKGEGCSVEFLLAIARFITSARSQGKEIILVSSGSVAAGRGSIPVTHQPTIAEKQAMASIGQLQLMATWSRFFDFPCAQILLTYGDLKDRTRYVNIKNTLTELLRHQALPIVNENDSVAVNEIKVGDNDNLAAYTALVSQADTLIICSDVDGLYSADPRKDASASLISSVDEITEEHYALAGGAGSKVGTGGMRTKLQAAQKCTLSGIQSLIVNGYKADTFEYLLQEKSPGTYFHPKISRSSARRHWLQHALPVSGDILLDDGALTAIREKGASLLPSGIRQVKGSFLAGEAVTLSTQNGVFAKGLVLYGSDDLAHIIGKQSHEIQSLLGFSNGEVVVHRDDLIKY
ncbi:MAG: glutamate 5-kinase [Aestuariibacter sp.]